jgi:uncharacterized membrane-anchored protein YhcB (DUF1043 family)
MTWLTRNLGWMIALAGLLVGGAVGYGRIAQTTTLVQTKADKEAVSRELDLVHNDLLRVEGKLDSLIALHIPK